MSQKNQLTNVVEAILLAAGRPMSLAQIAELFDDMERPATDEIRAALASLAARYATSGIEIAEVASGWRIQVRPQHADIVSRLWQERPARYSRALLETLALIAYRQPITRGEIESIRGVTVASTIMRTLHERNWIRVVGHREVPGRPELLGTTREFLDYFGLRSLDDLPTLAELRDLDDMKVQLDLAQESVEQRSALPPGSGAAPRAMPSDEGVDEDEGGSDDADGAIASPEQSPTMVASQRTDGDR
jgi:segregation and condensation protein B